MLSISNELQDRWMNNQLIGLDIILADDGMAIPINIESIRNDNLAYTFRKEYSISYGSEMSLDELFDNYDDPWSEVQTNNKIQLDDNSFILCGEGEMGNEGFIVKTDSNNKISWMLYSSSSNPFINMKKIDDTIYIQSTDNFFISLNIMDNSIIIINEDIHNILKSNR